MSKKCDSTVDWINKLQMHRIELNRLRRTRSKLESKIERINNRISEIQSVLEENDDN